MCRELWEKFNPLSEGGGEFFTENVDLSKRQTIESISIIAALVASIFQMKYFHYHRHIRTYVVDTLFP